MDAGSITGMISGASEGGASTGMAIWQYYKAKKLEEEAGARPIYETPASQQQALFLSKQATNQDYVGKDSYEQSVSQRTGSQISNIQDTASSPVAALTAVNRAFSQENELMLGSDVRNQQYKDTSTDKYMQQLGIQAGYEDKEWQQNKWNRYMDYSTAAGEMNAAAMGNFMEGVSAGNYGGAQGMGGMDTTGATPTKGVEVGGGQNNQGFAPYGYNNGSQFDSFAAQNNANPYGNFKGYQPDNQGFAPYGGNAGFGGYGGNSGGFGNASLTDYGEGF